MRPWPPLLLALLTAGAGGACADDPSGPDAPLVVDEGCQPLLAGTSRDELSQATCLLPYPSDFHRLADPSMPTGFRVAPRGSAKLRTNAGKLADPHDGYAADGASTIPAILATLPTALSRDGLPGITADPAASMRPESATLLLEADTGTLVAHYTDLHEDDDDGKHAGIVLRPLAPLRPRTRYIAALAGVRTPSGDAAPPAEGFRRMRDAKSDERFEREVFAPLERLGIARSRLQLAWDFTTGSAERPTRDLARVVELTRAWLATTAPEVHVTSSADDRVTLTITVPSFLDDGGRRARLFRAPDGQVAQNGTATVEVLVIVPPALRGGTTPGRALAFGHGFFGGKTELESTTGRTIAAKLGAITFGIDWRGMSREDIVAVADTFAETPERAADFAERVHQAMASWIVTTSLVRTRLVDLPELRRKDGGPLWDPAFLGYFGASQGHILGGTLSAIDPDIERAVLNVGGGGFVHIMPRSGAFGTFALVLRSTFKDSLTRLAFTTMLQPSLDRIDPVTYGPRLADKALLQVVLGDNAVPTSSGFLHARSIGAKQIVPAPRRIWGLGETPGGEPGATITLFDYGIEIPTDAPLPQNPNPLHDTLRLNEAALRQMDAFLKPGGIAVNACEGACDPL